MINRREELITARTFAGMVVDLAGEPIAGALVEVRGPELSEVVKGTTVDQRGGFKFARLKAGSYTFKVTRDGFQSVAGRLQIAEHSVRNTRITFALRPGV